MPYKKQYWSNPEIYRRRSLEYRVDNIDIVREKDKVRSEIYRNENPEKRRVTCKRYREENHEKISESGKIYKRKMTEKRLEQVFNIIPNRCYYENEYCSGRLEWDHKYGDGKNGRPACDSFYKDVLTNPDRWMRLCRLHNHMKANIPKQAFETMILMMAEKIKSYGQVNHVPPEPDAPFLAVWTR